MTNAPIRIVVLLAALSLTGITVTQVYLVNKTVNSLEQQFNNTVQLALRNVVESVCEVTGVDVPTNDPIDQISPNYFVVRTNSKIDLPSLEYHLIAELQKREIKQDFEYGVYDCQTEKMVYGNFVSLSQGARTEINNSLPELEDYDYYFGVYFPGKTSAILWGVDWWKYSSFLTVLILIFFAYTLFIILRQKRLSSVQRDFVNNITHEFKTPLSTLKVASGVIADPSNQTDHTRIGKYANIIASETSRLETQVEQLLKSALIEGKQEVSIESIDLSMLVQSLNERIDVSSKEIEIHCQHDVFVLADRFLLETVIFNLIDNAIKYGGDRIKIEVESSDRSGIIRISDNGVGIPNSDKKRIFQKFYRLQSGDLHDVKGFGLGLYVVKKSIKKMKGSIDLDCDPGCRFTITLPKS